MENKKIYHGYLVLPRHSKLLLHELGYDLFGFYMGLVMSAVWFRGNQNFGYITKKQSELARELNINQPTVSRRFKDLEKHKQFVIRHKNHILVCFLPLFLKEVASKIHSKDYQSLNDLYTDMYEINTELQREYINLHHNLPQNDIQRVYSSSKKELDSLRESLDEN